MCKHDPLYRQDNEANGGAGCPLCAAQGRRNMTLAEMAETILHKWEDAHPELFVEGAVASQEDFDDGACIVDICADCGVDCADFTAAILPQSAAHPVGAAAFKTEHYERILPAFEPTSYDFTSCKVGTWVQRHQ